jgi:glycosyltransferase involved in cell wall biosynthesis
MRHSIISWDGSYRNFFHLINGLLWQRYPREDFELIYVEQRSKKIANDYNHSLGLKSLEDRYEEVKDKMNIRIIYLNEPKEIPFHWGKCSNAGLSIVKGEIISVIDGDLLFPPDFLEKLSVYHLKHPRAVVDIYRKGACYPVGVKSFKDWKRGSNNFYKCLNATPDKYGLILNRYGFGGPMISAKKEFWLKTGGYDPHPIWSTNLAPLGGDLNTRMEIATGSRSRCLPDCFAVHPWHPPGTGLMRGEEKTLQYFSLLEKLTKWSIDNQKPHHQDRKEFTDRVFEENKAFVQEFINLHSKDEEKNEIFPEDNILKQKIICKYKQFRTILGRIRRGIFGSSS